MVAMRRTLELRREDGTLFPATLIYDDLDELEVSSLLARLVRGTYVVRATRAIGAAAFLESLYGDAK